MGTKKLVPIFFGQDFWPKKSETANGFAFYI